MSTLDGLKIPYRRRPYNRLADWEMDIIIALYTDDVPVPEIAKACNVSTSTIYMYLREFRAIEGGWELMRELASISQRERPRNVLAKVISIRRKVEANRAKATRAQSRAS